MRFTLRLDEVLVLVVVAFGCREQQQQQPANSGCELGVKNRNLVTNKPKKRS